jgi:hypothetical protein
MHDALFCYTLCYVSIAIKRSRSAHRTVELWTVCHIEEPSGVYWVQLYVVLVLLEGPAILMT